MLWCTDDMSDVYSTRWAYNYSEAGYDAVDSGVAEELCVVYDSAGHVCV